MKYLVKVNGKQFEVEIDRLGEGVAAPTPVAPAPVAAPVATPTPVAPTPVAAAPAQGGDVEVVAPMPGSVFKILKNVGDSVVEGEAVAVLEAMKMEIEVNATASGTVKQVLVNVGAAVAGDDVLLVLN